MRPAVLLLLAAACTPSNVTPPPDADAARPGPSSACPAACAAMAAVQCPEGAASNCVEVCVHATASALTPLKTDCLSAAKSQAEVRACGVACSPQD